MGSVVPALCVVAVFLLTIVPIFILIRGSFQTEAGIGGYDWTLQNYIDAYTNPATYSMLWTSVLFALGSLVVGLGTGLMAAWIIERTDAPWTRAARVLVIGPMLIPGVLVSAGWIFLVNPATGLINSVIESLTGWQWQATVFSLPGMSVVQGLFLSPLAFLMFSAALKSMDPSLEEAAAASGAGTRVVLRRVTMPMLMPVTASVALLLVVQSLDSFDIPAVLGMPERINVFSSQIYLAFRGVPPDYGTGGALSVGLIVIMAIGLAGYRRLLRREERYQTITGKAFRPRAIPLGRWRWPATAALYAYLMCVLILPIFILAWASLMPYYQTPSLEALGNASLENYRELFALPGFWSALRNSVLSAAAAATIVMVLASVVGWVVTKRQFRGRSAIDFMTFLPVALPGVVLGVAYILIFAGSPLPIYGTLVILILAYSTKYLPYGMRTSTNNIGQIHKELEEAAWASGAGWGTTFRRVVLPLLRPGFVAGWIFAFVLSVREFSSSLLLAGRDNRVVAVLIFDLLETGQTTTLAALGVVLVVAITVIVAAVHLVSRRFGVKFEGP
jgi:iron(III) transport system permease protein